MNHEKAKKTHPFVKEDLIDRLAAAGADVDGEWTGCMALDPDQLFKAMYRTNPDGTRSFDPKAGVKNIEDQLVEKTRQKKVSSLSHQCADILGGWGLLDPNEVAEAKKMTGDILTEPEEDAEVVELVEEPPVMINEVFGSPEEKDSHPLYREFEKS